MVVEQQAAKVKDVALTPSARLHRLMLDRKQPFASLGLEMAFEHHATMTQRRLPDDRQTRLVELADQRRDIETSEEMSFEAYLADYLSFHKDA